MIGSIRENDAPRLTAPPLARKAASEPAQAGDHDKFSRTASEGKEKGASASLLDGLMSAFSNDGGPTVSRQKLGEMSDGQREQLKEMRKVDKAVEEHEMDHYRAAEELAQGMPSYESKLGPDGQAYRMAGKVMIDTGEDADAEKTVKKMQKVQRSALAPSHNTIAPLSDADEEVAAGARLKEQKAQARLDQEKKGT
ncbi:MAG: hypothetical protein KC910_03425 [Candidatus Eremiobacteraeota bacterium]|nr:hypothetical protein [Candidatus Eremiobacteraeota bacterium]